MKTYGGGADIKMHVFLTAAPAGGECKFTSRPLHPRGNSPQCILDRRISSPQRGYEQRERDKNVALTRTRTATPLARLRFIQCDMAARRLEYWSKQRKPLLKRGK
jgi:hypothetical protein